MSSPSAHQEQNLTNLTDRHVKALQENINNRFDESLQVLTALRIFDVTAIPNRSDVGSKDYRVRDVQIQKKALMQISINRLKLKELECISVVKELVKQWLKEKPKRKLAKKSATGNRNTSTVSTSDVAVQVEISETEVEEPENIDDSKVVQTEKEDQLQLEVNAAIAVMKLPDGGDSDSDSAFESDNDYD